MKDKQVLDKLRNDEDYYGEFGKQYFSYSDINTLINNPELFKKPVPNNINFVSHPSEARTLQILNKKDKYCVII